MILNFFNFSDFFRFYVTQKVLGRVFLFLFIITKGFFLNVNFQKFRSVFFLNQKMFCRFLEVFLNFRVVSRNKQFPKCFFVRFIKFFVKNDVRKIFFRVVTKFFLFHFFTCLLFSRSGRTSLSFRFL